MIQAAIAGHRARDLRHEHPDRPRLRGARSAHPARLMARERHRRDRRCRRSSGPGARRLRHAVARQVRAARRALPGPDGRCARCSARRCSGDAATSDEPARAQRAALHPRATAGSTCSAPMRSAAASSPGSSSPRRTRWRSPPPRSPSSLLIGGTLGLIAGYRGGWLGNLILRLADIIMSFPSLLLAVVVLYMFEPRVGNLVWCWRSPACRSTCAPRAPRCWRSASACSSPRPGSWARAACGSCSGTSRRSCCRR